MKISLLAIIGRLHPEIYDVLPTHGPLRGRADLGALKPQPLPPKAFAVAAAELAATVVHAAAAEEARAADAGVSHASMIIDEWCGTPWPRRWPFPVPFPGPEPGPYEILTGRIAAALAFASAGSRIQDEGLAATLLQGADRLAEVALADYAAATGAAIPAQASA